MLVDPIDDNKVYVGKSNNPIKRYNNHLYSDKYISKKYFWIKSLLKKKLKPRLIILCKTNIKHWKEAERYFIRKCIKDGKNIKNLTYGGNGTSFCTPETSKKLSESRLGSRNHNFGKHLSDITKHKLRTKRIGKKHSRRWRENIKKGVNNSEKFKSALLNPERGKKIAQTKTGMSYKNSKSVSQYDLDNNIIAKYRNITEAYNETGINLSSIRLVCEGIRQTAGKFKWKYE
jgi:hypothetical protein